MITLYSTNCPRCLVLERKLQDKGIEFEINRNVDEMIEMGIMSAPVLKIKGQLLQFGEAVKWINEQED